MVRRVSARPFLLVLAALLALRTPFAETADWPQFRGPDRKVVELLKGGSAPEAIWDAAFPGAAELMLRKPALPGNWVASFVPLLAATTLNALHYAYTASGQDDMRRFLLLMAAAVVPVFRDNIKRWDGKIAELRLGELEPAVLEGPAAIFTDVPKDRTLAVRKALTYLKDDTSRS
jgi:hypothetical protein